MVKVLFYSHRFSSFLQNATNEMIIDYFDIEAESDVISTILEEKTDDILPPMTLFCEQVNESDKYHYQVCSLAYVLERIKELKNK